MINSEVRGSYNLNVLVVEDDFIVAEGIRIMLEKLGTGVIGPVSSTEAAREILLLQKPDLALLDLTLKGETSMPLARELLAQGIPIFFATGYASFDALPDDLQTCPRLSKPMDPEKLRNVINGFSRHPQIQDS